MNRTHALLQATAFLSAIAIGIVAQDHRSRCFGAPPSEYFGIRVVDEETRRGVPLVELETVNHIRFVTDSQGYAAINDPDLLNRKVFFTVRSHGYEYPKDGFGFHGKAVETIPGQTEILRIKRRSIAERLYRTTGSGIEMDSVLLGKRPRIPQPVLNAGVFGCDSVMTAEHQGKHYWFWGDTLGPGYPLGVNFHITGATSPLQPDHQLAPDDGINLTFITDDTGRVKKLAEMPGEGPTWISAVSVLPDEDGQPRIYANYVKIRNGLEAYRWGFVVWNDEQEVFEHISSTDEKPLMFPDSQSHTFMHGEGNSWFHYFGNPLALTRVKPTGAAFVDPDQYEGFTCLKQGTVPEDQQVERDDRGRVVYGWKMKTPPLTREQEANFVESGVLKPNECRMRLEDIETGKVVETHNGSVYWTHSANEWTLIVSQVNGETSHLGEVWFAKSISPTGPWKFARRIVTHKQMTFYNPKQHPFLGMGDYIYFEGTYTTSFSGNPVATPRYEYNQIMYRLRRNHHALQMPILIYSQNQSQDLPPFTEQPGDDPKFYACLGAMEETWPVVWNGIELKLCEHMKSSEVVAFYARRSESPPGRPQTVPLYEFRHFITGRRVYSTDPSEVDPAFEQQSVPVCYVWPHEKGSPVFRNSTNDLPQTCSLKRH